MRHSYSVGIMLFATDKRERGRAKHFWPCIFSYFGKDKVHVTSAVRLSSANHSSQKLRKIYGLLVLLLFHLFHIHHGILYCTEQVIHPLSLRKAPEV